MAAVIGSAQSMLKTDPSANGIAAIIGRAKAYMGWRTTAYGPKSMTC